MPYSLHRDVTGRRDVPGHHGVRRDIQGCSAPGDVRISETLQTDEIPREPTMDNVIPAR